MLQKVLLLLACIYVVQCATTIQKPSSDESRSAPKWRPVVLMHGLLAGAEAMSHAAKWISQDFPGIYIHNVEIGNGRDDSMFMDINKQVESFAAQVQADPNLKQGFNLIGHSQGGLITRAYIERYNNPPVYNYMSWVGPMDGVYGTPDLNYYCPDSLCPWLNWIMDAILADAWWEKEFQEHIAFAAYWKSPIEYQNYLKHNIFLADINNEKETKNSTYKKNFSSLNHVLLTYSTIDNIVVPPNSGWFYFFEEGSTSTIVPLKQSKQYIEDWIGLRTLDESGRLQLEAIDCDHQDVPRDVCKKYYDMYTKPLLNNTLPAF